MQVITKEMLYTFHFYTIKTSLHPEASLTTIKLQMEKKVVISTGQQDNTIKEHTGKLNTLKSISKARLF